MYVLEPSACKFIPKDKHFHMTDLIKKVKKEGLNVGVYPISEKSYIDVGHLGEYKQTLKLLLDN